MNNFRSVLGQWLANNEFESLNNSVQVSEYFYFPAVLFFLHFKKQKLFLKGQHIFIKDQIWNVF